MVFDLVGGGGFEQVRVLVTLGIVYAEAVAGANIVASLNLGAMSSGRNVVAFSVAKNNFAAVAHGGTLITDAFGTMPAITTLGVGCYQPSAGFELASTIELLATFPRACTAGELTAFVNNF